MLIESDIILNLLNQYNINIKGILHIGAHECEEKGLYNNDLHIDDSSIIWVDGNINKVNEMKEKGIANIYDTVLDESEKDIVFHITNNTQASSILQLNHEAGFYNDIHIIQSIPCKTEKLSTFFNRIGKNPIDYNFWNLDIQGSELSVLRGSYELLINCDAIYTEVNSEEVYKGCGLIHEIDELLNQYGFVRVHTKWTPVKWGDALYLKINK